MRSWHTTTPRSNNRHKNWLAATCNHTVTVHVNAVGLVDPLRSAQLKVSERCFFHFNCLHVAEYSRMEAVGLFSYCKPVTTRTTHSTVITHTKTHADWGNASRTLILKIQALPTQKQDSWSVEHEN